jgi:uncharacterized membrane protein YhaH (DUF805 family)
MIQSLKQVALGAWQGWKNPQQLGEELRTQDWLQWRHMVWIAVLFALPISPKEWVASEVFIKPLLQIIFLLYLYPLFEWASYRLVGVRLSVEVARKNYFGSGLVYLVAMLVLYPLGVIMDLIARPEGETGAAGALIVLMLLVILVAGIISVIKVVQVRKHYLQVSGLKAFLGMLAIPGTLVLIGLIMGGVLVGQDMIRAAERRVELNRQQQEMQQNGLQDFQLTPEEGHAAP